MMKPIVDAQEAVLRARERDGLIPLVPRYSTFLLLLGMVWPMHVDGVSDLDGLVYNAYLARLLSRGQYYIYVYIPLATTRRTHSTKFSRVFAFIIVLCFRGVFEGARRNGTIRLAQFNHF